MGKESGIDRIKFPKGTSGVYDEEEFRESVEKWNRIMEPYIDYSGYYNCPYRYKCPICGGEFKYWEKEKIGREEIKKCPFCLTEQGEDFIDED